MTSVICEQPLSVPLYYGSPAGLDCPAARGGPGAGSLEFGGLAGVVGQARALVS